MSLSIQGRRQDLTKTCVEEYILMNVDFRDVWYLGYEDFKSVGMCFLFIFSADWWGEMQAGTVLSKMQNSNCISWGIYGYVEVHFQQL